MIDTIFDTMIDRISKVEKDVDVISRFVATNEIIGFALDLALNEEMKYGDKVSD